MGDAVFRTGRDGGGGGGYGGGGAKAEAGFGIFEDWDSVAEEEVKRRREMEEGE